MRKLAVSPAGSPSQARVPGGPQAIAGYVIHTVFGAAAVSASNWVYVRIGNEYIRKPVSELAKGEEILFAKEALQGLTVDQVNEALLKSDRYAATYPVLFRTTRDGSRLSAFGHALLQGILTVPDWASVRGSVHIGANGLIQLDDDQQHAVAEFIRDHLHAASIAPVQAQHIRNGWLTGRVIAPRNRQQIFPALLPLAPELSALSSPDFEHAYRLYMAIRRCAIATLSSELGTNLSKRKSRPVEDEDGGSERLSVRPELELLIKHFASNVSTTHGAGRILEVRPLPKREVPHPPREEGVFFRGVVTHRLEEGSLRIKSPHAVMQEISVLEPILKQVMFEFLTHEIAKSMATDANGHATRKVSADLLTNLYAPLGFEEEKVDVTYARCVARLRAAGAQRLDEFVPEQKKEDDGMPPEEKSALRTQFAQALHAGELDRLYNLPMGTLAKACDYYCRLQSAVPEDIYYMQALQLILQLKERKAAETGQAVSTKVEERELRAVEQRISQTCGTAMNGRTNSLVISTAAYLCTNSMQVQMDLLGEVLMGRLTPMEALAEAGQQPRRLQRHGMLVEDEQALALLWKMDFMGIERLYPRANAHTRRPRYPKE